MGHIYPDSDLDPVDVVDPVVDDSDRELCDTLRALASVYADHPDYDPSWRA